MSAVFVDRDPLFAIVWHQVTHVFCFSVWYCHVIGWISLLKPVISFVYLYTCGKQNYVLWQPLLRSR